MPSRRRFLTGALAGSTGVLLAAKARAQTATPAPSATPSPKPPSALALLLANDMRRFDPQLTDAQIANIAGQIDGNLESGARLNPRGKRLANSDEPITTIRMVP